MLLGVSMKGKLIVLEGGDSSGKSTQLKLLTEKLESEGKEVVHMHFPKHEVSFGKVVDAYLRGEYGDKNAIPPEFIAMLYMADFYESKKDMEKMLDEGKIILLSRYFSSTLSYQVALTPSEEKDDVWNWIKQVCIRLPQPDLTLVLYVPVEYSVKLLDNAENAESYKQGAKRDQHEADVEFQKDFMKEYDRNIGKLNWTKLDCIENNELLSIESIQSKVWDEVKKVTV
jgi:dTMP kinase